MGHFERIKEFVAKQMRMSHVYQPLMIKTLLRSRGVATTDRIAREFLAHDQAQIDYYKEITHRMVGPVLRKRGVVDREGDRYRLIGGDSLSLSRKEELLALCEERLDEYVTKRGARIWSHRRKSEGYVPGSLRYEVLVRAKYRCELCGISAEEKALEVDHILPRNHGGADEDDNLQALCYSCNAMKRDRDTTDFRGWRRLYGERQCDCPFCDIPAERVINENNLAFAILDGYPVTPLHTLVIPKRHVDNYFALSRPELNACHRLLEEERDKIKARDAFVAGFNVGTNSGEAAGQSVFHCHIHLIPRRTGDTPVPKGGVRNVIPGKGAY